MDQRHLPSFSQGSLYFSAGTRQTPFPHTSAQSWLLFWSVPSGHPQQHPAERQKPKALVFSWCLLLWFLGSMSSSAAPPAQAQLACCRCGCATVLWHEAWGKGSSMGEKGQCSRFGDLPPVNTACHLRGQPSPKARQDPHARCKVSECCFNQHDHIVCLQGTRSLPGKISIFQSSKGGLCISSSERALALRPSGLSHVTLIGTAAQKLCDMLEKLFQDLE